MGGSRPVGPYHAATAALKMPLKKCFQFVHLPGFVTFEVDYI